MSPRRILTAAEMRAAEARAIAAGTPESELMERAGTAAAEAIRRYAGPIPALILCGPGNNGGDGYVIARWLHERGVAVRVAALGEPATPAARAARERWTGPVEEIVDAAPATLLIDALFGTGLTRPLDAHLSQHLLRLAAAARVRVAVDLPSGAATDDGAILSPLPDYDLTVSFAALKPAHRLQPAAGHMGRIVVADIGVDAFSSLHEIARPRLSPPVPGDHKYSRGYVVIVGGQMPGASGLTASAALRSGAGYVRLIAPAPIPGLPHAIVQSRDTELITKDERIDVVAIGPGLGRGDAAGEMVKAMLAAGRANVLDADALWTLGDSPPDLTGAIITPHDGEFARLFGTLEGSKVDQARAVAARCGAAIVYKGSDTVIAGPDGRAAIAAPAPSWLASAGTGDVLTGIVAAMRARGLPGFEAACAGVWLHSRAATLAGPGLIADDLVSHLPAALAECL